MRPYRTHGLLPTAEHDRQCWPITSIRVVPRETAKLVRAKLAALITI
jgi:hypothetical protein